MRTWRSLRGVASSVTRYASVEMPIWDSSLVPVVPKLMLYHRLKYMLHHNDRHGNDAVQSIPSYIWWRDPNIFSIINTNKVLLIYLISLRKLNIMSNNDIADKHGNIIHQGDYVATRIRGGTHEGSVSRRNSFHEQPWFYLNGFSGQKCANSSFHVGGRDYHRPATRGWTKREKPTKGEWKDITLVLR